MRIFKVTFNYRVGEYDSIHRGSRWFNLRVQKGLTMAVIGIKAYERAGIIMSDVFPGSFVRVFDVTVE